MSTSRKTRRQQTAPAMGNASPSYAPVAADYCKHSHEAYNQPQQQQQMCHRPRAHTIGDGFRRMLRQTAIIGLTCGSTCNSHPPAAITTAPSTAMARPSSRSSTSPASSLNGSLMALYGVADKGTAANKALRKVFTVLVIGTGDQGGRMAAEIVDKLLETWIMASGGNTAGRSLPHTGQVHYIY